MLGAKSQHFGGLLLREGRYRYTVDGGSKITVVWLAPFGEKTVIGSRVLVGGKSQCFGGSLCQEGRYREMCVGGKNITVVVRLACFSEKAVIGSNMCWWHKNQSD